MKAISLSSLEKGIKKTLLRNLTLDRKIQKSTCKATKALQNEMAKLAQLKKKQAEANNKTKAEAVAKKKAAVIAARTNANKARVLAIIARIENEKFILGKDYSLLLKNINNKDLRSLILAVLNKAKNAVLDNIMAFSQDITMFFKRATIALGAFLK